MKKVFSNVFLIFVQPVRFLRKIKLNNFLGGLVLGALVSLIVNVVTVQIQEKIHKQRILEAVENEVSNNMLQASNALTQNNDTQQKNKGIDNFHTFRKYSRDLWEQSTEPLQYIAQLDQQTQINLSGYYSITVPANNLYQDKLNTISDKMMENCFDEYGVAVLKEKIVACNNEYYKLLLLESFTTSKDIFDQSFKILKQFHPTADRLNNPFLRFLMGQQSMRILSGH